MADSGGVSLDSFQVIDPLEVFNEFNFTNPVDSYSISCISSEAANKQYLYHLNTNF